MNEGRKEDKFYGNSFDGSQGFTSRNTENLAKLTIIKQ
jgi:hypothetical protein